MRRRYVLSAVLACVIIAVVTRVNASDYRIRELPPLTGHVWASVSGLSNTGTVLGLSNNAANNYFFARWTPDGTPVPIGYDAWAINNLDQTAGRDGAGRIEIRDAEGNTLATYVNGVPDYINDLGAVLGSEYTASRTGLCYWAPDQTKYDIGLLPGCTGVSDCSMNNRGDVVGILQANDDNFVGFYWSVTTGLLDISSIVGGSSFLPTAINDNGAIVGFIRNQSDSAAVWTPQNGLQSLLSLPDGLHSYAYDINNLGQVVGGDNIGPILWNPDGTASRLSTLSAGLYGYAECINDNGVIAGWSNRTGALGTAVVWDPVPEPSAFTTLAGGLLASIAFLRKRVSR